MIELVGAACLIAGWFAYPLFHVEPVDSCQPALDQLAEAQIMEVVTIPAKKTEETKKPAPKPRGWAALRTEIEMRSEAETK